MKARILKTTTPTGGVFYTIQQRHYIFRWWWVDAWINSWLGAACPQTTFNNYADALKQLPLFNGGKYTQEVVA